MSDGGSFPTRSSASARALRRAGIPVGPAAVVDALRAVEDHRHRPPRTISTGRSMPSSSPAATSTPSSTRCSACSGAAGAGPAARSAMPTPPRAAREPSRRPAPRRRGGVRRDLGRARPPRPEIEIDARLSASESEALKRRDFAQMSAAEIAEAERQIDRLIMPRRARPDAPDAAVAAAGADRRAPDAPRQPSHRRRPDPAPPPPARRGAGRRSSCSATSPAR